MEELRGLLALGVLPEILRRIFLDQRSGVLHLAFGVDRADFDLSGGYLVQVVSTLPGARLGDLLVQMGFLSTRDRDACLEIAALANERLGQTLLRHGLIDTDHLAEGLALQLREVLARALVWSGGVYTFTDSPAGEKGSVGATAGPRVDPREVLLDATWTLANDPALDGLLGDLNRRLRKSTDKRLLRLDFRLTPADAFLLSRVDGDLTAEKLLQLSPGGAEEVKASLAGLLSVGAIEYVGTPAPTPVKEEVGGIDVAKMAGRLESADPFEVLGLTPEASSDEVRSTYLNLARTCDPSTTADSKLKPIFRRMSNQLSDAFKEIERRRGTPRPAPVMKRADRHTAGPPPSSPARPNPPSPPPPPLSRVGKVPKPPDPNAPVIVLAGPATDPPPPVSASDPSQVIEAAANASEEGRVLEALALLHEAIPNLTGRDRRAARVRKARVLLVTENGMKLAEEELKAAIAEDAANAEAHMALGGIYQERGSLALAAMEYRKALEIQPQGAIAREAHQALKALPGDTAGGQPAEPSVLKRIFGR